MLQNFEGRHLLPGVTKDFLFAPIAMIVGCCNAKARRTVLTKAIATVHHFVAGLPDQVARKLRVITEIKTVSDALTRAQLLIGTGSELTVPKEFPVVATTIDLQGKKTGAAGEANR